jgi:hypothetical protein
MRSTLLALSLVLAPLAAPSTAQAHGRVGLTIGFSLPAFPELVQVPGYPVYYAPRVAANYFFHDGLFWLYSDDGWHSSAWYDGPWDQVAPEYVPAFVLRVPVGYYRSPPRFFAGWHRDHAPRWGDHWGRDWERHRHGWDRWDRRADVRPAPLPSYQRQYAGHRYPREVERQRVLRVEHVRRGWDDGHRGHAWDDDGHRGRGRGRGGDDDGHRGRGRGRGGDDDGHRGRGGDHR